MNNKKDWEVVIVLGLVDFYFVFYCIFINLGIRNFSLVDFKVDGVVNINFLNNVSRLIMRRVIFIYFLVFRFILILVIEIE